MKKIVTDIKNHIYLYESDIKLKKVKKNIEGLVVRVYKDKVFSKYLGFGGAITESSAYNYSLLSDDIKKDFINAYFSKEGLNYKYGRISIGSCDFSLKSYEYSKKKDLRDFSISHDNEYIIPLLKDIYNIKDIDLLASPWSPPKMYKNSLFLILGGKLKKKYYSNYAKYLKLFIDEYKRLGFNIKYLTIQNEPLAIQIWESCIFNLEEQKDFIYNYMVKELNDIDTSILLWDHNKEDLYHVCNYLYENNEKVKGIAFHWYSGSHFNNLNMIKQDYPNMLLVNSETCCGYSLYNEQEWVNDAINYITDIISDINNGLNIYFDWNILLDYNGGPNHKKNYCKSPIILNEEKNNFIKTPIYYYLYHITRLEENSDIIYNSSYAKELLIVSSKKDNKMIITILNPTDRDFEYNLIIDDLYVKDIIHSKNIITYEKDI
ncbi:MAG: hypothetical protein IJ572_05160 [Bacilli bacterium]|nr:hypothetical protein [Bacilli bacterium]